MNLSRQQGTIMSTGIKQDIMLALEHEAEMARLWKSWRQFAMWMIPTLYLLFDIFAFRCGICSAIISFFLRCDEFHSKSYAVEVTSLAIVSLNLFVCLLKATKYSFCVIMKKPPVLTQKQAALLGITDQSHFKIVQPETKLQSQISQSSAESNRSFITQWLSALHFGDWPVQTTKHSSLNYIWQNGDDRSFGASSTRHSTPLTDHRSSFTDRHSSHSVSLSAQVGSRTSPRTRPTSSIQTSKQLEAYLQRSNDESMHSCFSSFSSGSKSLLDSESLLHIPKASVRLSSSGNSTYEIGTAMYDDEQGKRTTDENSVVSLVTGSRIVVTDKRISLSPIPLNLINVSTELTSENGKGIASDGTDVVRNSESDSVTFRVVRNAEKKSPKKGQESSPTLLRRSDSQNRRRTASLSPHIPFGNQMLSVTQLNNVPTTQTGKQIPITSTDILNQYRMDADDFAIGERNLRTWICQTILRPLISKIDEVNDLLTKSYAHTHLKIGHSSVETLHIAASSKSDLLKSPLPYVLPYLRAHEKQAYLVKRCRELSADVCMQNYNWESGGYETIERKEEGEHGYSPPERPWSTSLPTDAQLIWSWFSVYMDTQMGANPLVNDIEMPFSSVYYLKKPSKPSALQCMKKSFYIYQSSINPPHFELVLDGGHERFEIDRGARNLWRTILLFIQHTRLFSNAQLRNIKIDDKGINLACVLE